MKSKMVKKWFVLAGIAVSMQVLTACQQAAKSNGTSEDAKTHQDSESKGSNAKAHQDSESKDDNAKAQQDSKSKGNTEEKGEFYDGADLEGRVIKFTDTGCSIAASNVQKDGEGEVLEQVAPGSEDLSELIEITYEENCEFQIIHLDLAVAKEISREEAQKEDIKKETEIIVFGSCQDEYHWTARKVAILRWQ